MNQIYVVKMLGALDFTIFISIKCKMRNQLGCEVRLKADIEIFVRKILSKKKL